MPPAPTESRTASRRRRERQPHGGASANPTEPQQCAVQARRTQSRYRVTREVAAIWRVTARYACRCRTPPRLPAHAMLLCYAPRREKVHGCRTERTAVRKVLAERKRTGKARRAVIQKYAYVLVESAERHASMAVRGAPQCRAAAAACAPAAAHESPGCCSTGQPVLFAAGRLRVQFAEPRCAQRGARWRAQAGAVR